jgi:1,4-alpha-glucan branching enzyme
MTTTPAPEIGGNGSHSPAPVGRGLRKRPGATPGTVEVTFELPSTVDATEVAIVGEFNDWSPDALRVTRGDDGAFRATVVLEAGRRYRFRYFLDGERWENDWRADDYWPNQFGGDDSVVFTDDV